jgi:16S rRNA (uracil1498-N3)-methyltransferase
MITNFYTNPENVENETLTIDGEEARHILSVLRHKAGDTISVVDGYGTRYNVLIEKTSETSLRGKILSLIRKENEPTCHVTLAQAICRQERMDFLIEKATEIGVSSVIPILTERSLIRISGIALAKTKVERWRRIAIAGMKQSLRTLLPEIQGVTKFEELPPQMKSYDLCLIASLDRNSKGIRELHELRRRQKKILLIVGPEAGFAEEELALTEAQGAIPITLGTRRLRTETAGVVFLSLLLHQLGDLG